MLINYFKSTKPINFILLSFLFVFIIWSHLYLENKTLLSTNVIIKLLGLVVSFYLFVFVTKDTLRSSKNDFGILMYVLLTAFFISSIDLNKLGANILITIALYLLYRLKNKNIFVKESVFNIGILLGVSTILYPLSILFLLYSYVIILRFSYVNWRTIIIPIIGFLIPFLILFLFNDQFLLEIALPNLPVFSFNMPFLQPYLSIFLITLMFWALFSVFSQLNISLLYYKDYFFLMVVHLIIAISFLFLSPNKDGSEFLFLLYPLSSLLANFFTILKNKWLSNITLVLFIISAFTIALQVF